MLYWCDLLRTSFTGVLFVTYELPFVNPQCAISTCSNSNGLCALSKAAVPNPKQDKSTLQHSTSRDSPTDKMQMRLWCT